MLFRGFDIDFGFVFRVLRNLKIVQRACAVGVKILRSVELRARQDFVRQSFSVIRIACGNVVASHTQQDLALLHRVAEARTNIDDTPGGQ